MLCLLLPLLALSYNGFDKFELDEAWHKWQDAYYNHPGVNILGDDMVLRKAIFSDNYHRVRGFNNEPGHTFFLELNEYAHLTEEEFGVRYGFNPEKKKLQKSHSTKYIPQGNVPDSVDWRPKLVTKVKNQGSCGSCWAFSTIVSLEGQYAKATGEVQSFSEQDLVDCVKKVSINGTTCCDGCQGGLMDYAFEYIIQSQKGLEDKENNYPYTGRNGNCKFSPSGAASDEVVTKFQHAWGEDALKDAVANVGPLSVAVDANIFWQLYGGGYFNPLVCSNQSNKLDHGVAVVGYGTCSDGDYWIIKNSWGATWGESGYVRLARNKGNKCGVADTPVFPVLQKANKVEA